jgi:hypothetical protein
VDFDPCQVTPMTTWMTRKGPAMAMVPALTTIELMRWKTRKIAILQSKNAMKRTISAGQRHYSGKKKHIRGMEF